MVKPTNNAVRVVVGRVEDGDRMVTALYTTDMEKDGVLGEGEVGGATGGDGGREGGVRRDREGEIGGAEHFSYGGVRGSWFVVRWERVGGIWKGGVAGGGWEGREWG